MNNRLAMKFAAGLFALSSATGAVAGTTPWLDRDNPGGTGDWENLSALVKVECAFTATGQTTAGTAGYTCDTAGSICRNSAAVACQDTKVRYLFDDLRGRKAVTPWLNRDNPSGDGDWETTTDLLKVACKFTATNAAVTPSAAYVCGNPDVRSGGAGVNARNGGKPVDNLAVQFSW